MVKQIFLFLTAVNRLLVKNGESMCFTKVGSVIPLFLDNYDSLISTFAYFLLIKLSLEYIIIINYSV